MPSLDILVPSIRPDSGRSGTGPTPRSFRSFPVGVQVVHPRRKGIRAFLTRGPKQCKYLTLDGVYNRCSECPAINPHAANAAGNGGPQVRDSAL
jgi:hypothetical protein